MRAFWRNGWPALVTGVLLVGVGQLGQLPVPLAYRSWQHNCYSRARALVRSRQSRPDAVVVGNSAIQFGVDAAGLARHLRLPGMGGAKPRVINIALPGANPVIDLWLWRRLARTDGVSKTKVLIVGVAPLDFAEQSPGRDDALRYLYDADDALWLLASARINDAAALLTYRSLPLYARNMAFRNWLAGYKPPPVAVLPDDARMAWVLGLYENWYRGYRVQPIQIRCLNELIADAQKRGVRVVLVSVPVHRGLQAVTEGFVLPRRGRSGRLTPPADASATPLRQFDQAIRHCAASRRVPYFDYLTRAQSVRFTHVDPAHLAAEGAVRFTNELADRLNKELAKPRHLGKGPRRVHALDAS